MILIHRNTLIICLLAVVSTYLSIKFGYLINLPLTIVGTAVIFPLVFTINAAYKRRETALRDYANIKAQLRFVYYTADHYIKNLPKEVSDDFLDDVKQILKSIVSLLVNEYCDKKEAAVYKSVNNLSVRIQTLRDQGLPSGEASRCNQFLSKAMISFEAIKHIHQYRTPRELRKYSNIFVYVIPIAYGPYFANVGSKFGLFAYMLPILFAVIFVSLDNIQEALEDPFDGESQDDIKFNVDKFIENCKTERTNN